MFVLDLQALVAWMGIPAAGDVTFVDTYVRTLRGSFFTGFITLGSLVTAAMNYTLTTLKAGIYDTTEYKAFSEKVKTYNSKFDPYAPLKRLGSALFAIIVASFFTSFAQVTIGLVPFNWAAIICIGSAIVTMFIVMIALLLMAFVLRDWKDHLPGQLPGGPSALKTVKPTKLFRAPSDRPSV
jgi:hypothetical protein